MMKIFYLFMIIFEFCFDYDIIPIKNFEKKFVHLTTSKNFIIFKYNLVGSSNLTTFYHQINKIYFGLNSHGLDFYFYDNESQITDNGKGHFINYSREKYLSYYSSYFDFEDSFYGNKTYYIVIQTNILLYDDFNFTLSIYSTESFTNIDDFLQSDMTVYIRQNLNYKFHIPLEHKKYILFEFRTIKTVKMAFMENNQAIIYQNNSFNGANYLELKDGCSYDIYANIQAGSGDKYQSCLLYFYFAQSNFVNFIPITMNTEYFYHLYANRKLKLLFDLTSIKKDYLIWVEYRKNWGGNSPGKAYGYTTLDEDIIESTEGIELDIYEKECNDNICKDYIVKNSDDIKLVIIEVEGRDEFNPLYYDIKYGNPEKYVRSIYISFIIGLGLSLPNLVIHLIKCFKNGCKCRYKCALSMDFILHMAYGCLISVYLFLGAESSLIASYAFLGAYGLFLIVNVCLVIKDRPSMFYGINCLIKKVGKRSFNRALNERRILPPKIVLYKNFENHENENGFEYVYNSWEDNTHFILNKKSPILNCHFNFLIKLEPDTENDLEKYKRNYPNNETPTDDGYTQGNENNYVNYSVPNFKNDEICVLKEANSKDRFFIFLWIILFLIGYFDILEIFICCEIDKISVGIVKVVSHTNKYRACYKVNDVIFDEYSNIPNKSEQNELCENKYTEKEQFLAIN